MKTILPADVVSYIKDLERRIRLLEARPQLSGSNIAQTFTDSNGAIRVVIGLQADNTYGVRVLDGVGNVIFNQGVT